MSTIISEQDAPRPLTADQLDYMRSELADQFPHLSVSVEGREGTVYVTAVPA